MKAEGKLVPKRKKKKINDDSSITVEDSSVSSTGKVFVKLIIVN